MAIFSYYEEFSCGLSGVYLLVSLCTHFCWVHTTKQCSKWLHEFALLPALYERDCSHPHQCLMFFTFFVSAILVANTVVPYSDLFWVLSWCLRKLSIFSRMLVIWTFSFGSVCLTLAHSLCITTWIFSVIWKSYIKLLTVVSSRE